MKGTWFTSALQRPLIPLTLGSYPRCREEPVHICDVLFVRMNMFWDSVTSFPTWQPVYVAFPNVLFFALYNFYFWLVVWFSNFICEDSTLRFACDANCYLIDLSQTICFSTQSDLRLLGAILGAIHPFLRLSPQLSACCPILYLFIFWRLSLLKAFLLRIESNISYRWLVETMNFECTFIYWQVWLVGNR